MADPRFFSAQGPFTLDEISASTRSDLKNPADGKVRISDVLPLSEAGEQHLSFLDNRKFIRQFKNTKATAAIVHKKFIDQAPLGLALLISSNPYNSYALAMQMFYPVERRRDSEVSKWAFVDKTAILGENCHIGSNTVIQPRARIGPNCFIGANAVIGEGSVIGAESWIGSNVSISYSCIGDNATIHDGVTIGQAGFGFAMGEAGHTYVPQVGLVIIGENVRIGANTTIDRGANTNTIIGTGCKIDNLVQIAHNVRLGKNCIIAGQAGIAGSTQLGNFVVVGGQVGIAGHLKIGDHAVIAGKSGITQDIPPGETYGGIPGVPIMQWRRQVGEIKNLVHKNRKNDRYE